VTATIPRRSEVTLDQMVEAIDAAADAARVTIEYPYARLHEVSLMRQRERELKAAAAYARAQTAPGQDDLGARLAVDFGVLPRDWFATVRHQANGSDLFFHARIIHGLSPASATGEADTPQGALDAALAEAKRCGWLKDGGERG